MIDRAGESLRIEGARLAGPAVPAAPVSISVDTGALLEIGPADGAETPAAGVTRVNAAGLLVGPGLIDLQVNGAAGHDLTADPEALWQVGAALPRYGVVAFLPTLVSPGPDVVDRARAAWLAGPPDGYAGARPLGWHVEGPFLSPKRAGAHELASLRGPDPAAVAGWSPATGIRMVTLAPELPRALDVVAALVGAGVVVSAGHSVATFEQASAGFDAGIRYVTHLFNAMAPLDHRQPGLPGAALGDPRVTIGLIPDGLHVHPAIVRLVRSAVGPERLSIVTDAMAALGMPPGVSRLAGRAIRVDRTSARLEDGTLAGSVLGLDQAVRNLAAFSGCRLDDALDAVTTVPARLLGLEARHGAMRAGSAPDLTLWGPAAEVALTIIGGAVAFDAAGGERVSQAT